MTTRLLFISLIAFSVDSFSQSIPGRIVFSPGTVYEVKMDIQSSVAQQVMGQAIDFNINGEAVHHYKVTNANNDNATLNHSVKKIAFKFDGMGQKYELDSDKPADMKTQFGAPISETLKKKYDMIVDPYGKVVMTIPEKVEPATGDGWTKLVTNMLKDVLDVVVPPAKGQNSFFGVLPESFVAGDSWTRTGDDKENKYAYNFTVSNITDTVIVIDYTGNTTSVMRAEMMGQPAVTTMNNKITGQYFINRPANIVSKNVFVTESNGTMDAMGGSVPVTSKTTTTILVAPAGN